MARFHRLASETILSSSWLRVERHRVGDASGADPSREVITFEMPDWVNVIARTVDGDFVFVRQHRFGTQDDSLEIPGGLIDPGESPEQAAARELREETGYIAGSLRSMGWSHPNPAVQANRLYTFVAEGCTLAGPPELDALEDCRVELVADDALDARIERREISHALVLLALVEYRLEQLRRQRASVSAGAPTR